MTLMHVMDDNIQDRRLDLDEEDAHIRTHDQDRDLRYADEEILHQEVHREDDEEVPATVHIPMTVVRDPGQEVDRLVEVDIADGGKMMGYYSVISIEAGVK